MTSDQSSDTDDQGHLPHDQGVRHERQGAHRQVAALLRRRSVADLQQPERQQDHRAVTPLAKVSGGSAVMIGDSPYDCIAAGKIDIPTIGVLTGGFSREELQQAGATQVFTSLEELQAGLDDTPLRAPSS